MGRRHPRGRERRFWRHEKKGEESSLKGGAEREGRRTDGHRHRREKERRVERTGRKVVERREGGGGLKRVSLGGKNIGGSEGGEEKRREN